ncbi:hypothetical protein Aduo_007436 [Ancylostoma duodenale]
MLLKLWQSATTLLLRVAGVALAVADVALVEDRVAIAVLGAVFDYVRVAVVSDSVAFAAAGVAFAVASVAWVDDDVAIAAVGVVFDAVQAVAGSDSVALAVASVAFVAIAIVGVIVVTYSIAVRVSTTILCFSFA